MRVFKKINHQVRFIEIEVTGALLPITIQSQKDLLTGVWSEAEISCPSRNMRDTNAALDFISGMLEAVRAANELNSLINVDNS